MDSKDALVVFKGTKIRRIWHDEQWFFSVVDIVAVLTESANPNNYWKVLKHREPQLVTICNQLKLPSADGKYYNTDCVNTQNAFRLIQSIPSPKAEPFKLWLAKIGYERVQEIENPELAQERMKQLYEQKGYSQEWIEKRLRGIAIRQELTDEWKERGIDHNLEYAILTNEISKATFGKTVDEHKNYKNLKKENMRDHMTDLELIFTMLGEKVTTEITRSKEAKNFPECKTAAREGGEVAGNARSDAENKIGKPVTSKENYLVEPEKVKRKRLQ
ncbi:MAG: BRO family protein [Nitrospirota bacterium]|nr:BRO family protein [Nitrospirota bacterium]